MHTSSVLHCCIWKRLPEMLYVYWQGGKRHELLPVPTYSWESVDSQEPGTQLTQAIIDLTSACLADGISVPKLTFPGQNPNRKLTSFTPSSTPGSSGAGTGISASTITTPGATVSPTTGVVASPTRTGNTGVKNANNTFSTLVVLLLGILIS